MTDIVIAGAVRTAIGKFGGGLAKTPAPELGATVIRALLARANLKPDLEKAGWKAADLDLMEINEAFAAQACAVNKEMGWDTSKINVNGGAIALGHPIGASGCRVLVTLLHEMVKRNAKRGLASLCIGGGMGVAMAVVRGSITIIALPKDFW